MKGSELEIKTVDIMIGIYCRHHHGKETLCSSCQELSSYARQRTLKCQFGEDKPTCGKCRTHCYKPQMKVEIRKVMQFSGPIMVYSHPILALRHLRAKQKEAPEPIKRKQA